jgi:hypothetical protein
MAKKPLKQTLLIATTSAILLCGFSGIAIADGDPVRALEARVAELESLVQQLLEDRKTPVPEEHAPALETSTKSAGTAKAAAMMEEHHVAQTARYGFKLGGYIKTDISYSDYSGGSVTAENVGRDFYIPSMVPVGGTGESAMLDYHMKASRIFFRSDHVFDNGDTLRSYVEVDGQLPPGGDERVSNSYNPRIRHAYLGYNKWLFGQTWTTFFNVDALPENLDFIGPAESTVFGRQTQIRYTSGPWMFALENPETTVTPFGGGPGIVTDDNNLPDLVLRYKHSSGITVAAMFRQLGCEDPPVGINDTTSGFGVSLSGKHLIGERDDIRWMATTGDGLGRYLGLNTANGAVLTANGELEAIGSTGIFGSFRHFWNDRWRSSFTVGRLDVDNDTRLTGTQVTAAARSYHLNLIFNAAPELDFGVEVMLAERELENGAEGDLTRFQFSAKYGF